MKARGVVSHHVSLPWEEVTNVAVAVEALVVASVTAEPGPRAIIRDGSFGESGQGRCVV